MKKMYFLLLAAAGLMSACSNDDTTSSGGSQELAKVPIEIGVGNNAVVTTRGTGTVGSEEDNKNWNGQYFNVYMLNKNTMTVAKFGNDDIYNNTILYHYSPDYALRKDNTLKFYPENGEFDFWGYRIDDAKDNGNDPVMTFNTLESDPTDTVSISTKFNIDGSQDVMSGKATLTDKQKDTLGTQTDRYFSAYAARRGVQPTINFEHLLTRLTFSVVAADRSAANVFDVYAGPVSVNSIKVKSPYKANLVVAYKDGYSSPDSCLTFEEETTDFTLKKRADNSKTKDNLVDLGAIQLKWEGDTGTVIKAGEALLVAPGKEAYDMTVYLSQAVNQNPEKPGSEKTLESSFPAKIQLASGKKFEAGHSYHVTIKVYGLQKILTRVTVTPWENDEDIIVDPEQDNY